jgi:diguanylate cyclase (GGDEF)-like protein
MAAACAVAVAVIGWLDYVTGREIGLSLLYLLPIAVAGWYAGVGPATVIGTLAAGVWMYADFSANPGASLAVASWNAFTRLVIFITEGVFIALLHRDRESLKQHIDREATLARTDPVTGLANARAFGELVGVHMKTAGAPLCLVYVDLDNFKPVNDALGHAAGDDILAQVAAILRLVPQGIAARVGGDEFALLLRVEDAAAAEALATRITADIRALAAVYSGIGFGASAGVAWFETVPSSVEEAIQAADEAMYVAKTRTKGSVSVMTYPVLQA